jgi:UPF0176 protein
MMNWTIATFYSFVCLDDPFQLRKHLLEFCQKLGIKGTILLAHEGVNATVAGSRQGIDDLLEFLHSQPEIGEFPHQESVAEEAPFARLKVKIKREIVSLGMPEVNPNDQVGTYVAPEQWNQLIADPDVVLVDTRNDFEVELGTFQGAMNPRTHSFRDLPEFVQTKLDPQKARKVAMFCTGGIRCEKATAYMLQQGFEQVYHLEGGILNYLKTVPPSESLWQGECFVFDERVAVDHNLERGHYNLCLGCGHPLSPADRGSPHYEEGIACPHCYQDLMPAKRARLEERQRQRFRMTDNMSPPDSDV